jgi:hypothetical protein
VPLMDGMKALLHFHLHTNMKLILTIILKMGKEHLPGIIFHILLHFWWQKLFEQLFFSLKFFQHYYWFVTMQIILLSYQQNLFCY